MGDKTLEETHAQNAEFFFNLASYIVACFVTIKHFPNIAAHFPPDTVIEDYVNSRMTEIINSLQHDPEIYKKKSSSILPEWHNPSPTNPFI